MNEKLHGDLPSPKGREKTDESLSAERAKADSSLEAVRDRVQTQGDEALAASRAEFDAATLKARQEADVGHDSSQGINRRIAKERELADTALSEERSEADAASEAERSEMQDERHKLFVAERSATDANLTNERAQTDEEVARAASALKTRDEFLAMVSHDLSNPLGSISMVADLLTGHPLYAAADGETRECIDMIGHNATEALRLVRDLIDMERMAAGKLGLEMAAHDVGELIQDAVDSAQHMAAQRKISITTTLDGRDLVVLCDQGRIMQVLSNLIGNAIKFTASGGHIDVSTSRRKGEVEVFVTDDGAGIPEDMLQSVFQRLWQANRKDGRGLGLGLYISKTIIEAHAGKIWAESTVGKGSSFRFTLPLRPKETR